MVNLGPLCFLSGLLVTAGVVAAGRKVEVALGTAWRGHHLLLEILSVIASPQLSAERKAFLAELSC
jgi:hypothetical protein